MPLSAKQKRRRADIRKAWAFIKHEGMPAYVSGYDAKTRKVIVSVRPEEYAARAQQAIKTLGETWGTPG